MCQLCTAKYELESAKLIEEDRKKCFPEKAEAQQGLPQWLQLAMLGNDQIQVHTVFVRSSKLMVPSV